MKFEDLGTFYLLAENKMIFGVLLPINLAQRRVKNASRVSKSRKGMAMLNSRIDGGYMNLTLIVNMMEIILDFLFSQQESCAA